ncbi:MAG: alpha/beta fold hydrolase [archaeon]|nr:alpha/beta fold hydrolase [archaeon]
MLPLGVLYAPRSLPRFLDRLLTRPSSTHGDYGLHSEEVSFPAWQDPRVLLRGTLTFPADLTSPPLPPTFPPSEDGRHLAPGLPNVAIEERNSGALVVVVHGHGSSRTRRAPGRASIFEKAVVPLARAGFHVLAIDLRNHGASAASGPVSFGVRESQDVLGAVQFARDQLSLREAIDPDRIGIYAESMGAAASIIALGKHPEESACVKALWSEGAFMSFQEALSDRFSHLRIPSALHPNFLFPCVAFWGRLLASVDLYDAAPLRYISSLRAPVILSHSHRDSEVTFHHGAHLHELASASMASAGTPPAVELFVTQELHTDSHLHPSMPQHLLQFFQQHL